MSLRFQFTTFKCIVAFFAILLCFANIKLAECQAKREPKFFVKEVASQKMIFPKVNSRNRKDCASQNLPALRYKSQKSEIINFDSPRDPFPFKRVYYGFQEKGLPYLIDSLVEEEYLPGKIRRTQYFIEAPTPLDAYLFDPLPLPGGEWILFKFGRADITIDSFGLYLFNRRTHQIKLVIDQSLVNVDIQVSPDGQFISFIVNGGRDGVSARRPKTLELWVHELRTGKNTRVARGNSLQYTVNWLSGARGNSREVASELSYSLLQTYKRPVGTGIVKRPTSYIYDCTAGTYRVWPEAGSISRPSPDGRWIIFNGSKDLNKDFDEDASEQGNYGVFLRKTGSTTKATPVVVPANLLNDEVIVPIVYTYWMPDSNRFFCFYPIYNRDKVTENEQGYGEWAILLFTIEPGDKVGRAAIKDVRVATTISVKSTEFEPEIFFMAFPSGDLAIPKNAASDLLIMTKSYTASATAADGNIIFAKRIYNLELLDITTGKVQPLKSWSGVRGIGALTADGKASNVALY